MDAPVSLVLAAACAVLAVLVLRIGWSRKARSLPVNAAGWGLMAVAAGFAWTAAGAWGFAVAALWGMGFALVLLGFAAATARPGKGVASNRRVRMLPEGSEPRRIGARVVTFLLTVPLALAVSVGLAVVVFALSDLAGASKADSVVLALFATPFLWAVLVHLVLIRSRRRDQLLLLAVTALPVVPVALSGVLA